MSALLFDLDGTIIDSREGIYKAYKKSLESICNAVDKKHFSEEIGPPIQIILKKIHPELDEPQMNQIIENFRELYDTKYYSNFSGYKHINGIIAELSKNNDCFIVTNKPTTPSVEIVRALGLDPFITNIIGIDYYQNDGGQNKKENIASLIEDSNLIRQDTYLIGDTAEDYSAAKANQIDFIAYTKGYYKWKKVEIDEFKNYYANILLLGKTVEGIIRQKDAENTN